MTTTTYKGYTIKTVGISQYIYRPGNFEDSGSYSDSYAQSMAAAKRWINEDIRKRKEGSLSLDRKWKK